MRNVTPVTIVNEKIDYDKLATKIGEQNERVMKKYDKASVYEIDGIIYMERGGKIPQEIGRKRNKTIIINKTNGRD